MRKHFLMFIGVALVMITVPLRAESPTLLEEAERALEWKESFLKTVVAVKEPLQKVAATMKSKPPQVQAWEASTDREARAWADAFKRGQNVFLGKLMGDKDPSVGALLKRLPEAFPDHAGYPPSVREALQEWQTALRETLVVLKGPFEEISKVIKSKPLAVLVLVKALGAACPLPLETRFQKWHQDFRETVDALTVSYRILQEDFAHTTSSLKREREAGLLPPLKKENGDAPRLKDKEIL